MTTRTPTTTRVGSTTLEVSPWLDARFRPAHEGVYQRRVDGDAFSCWNGRLWNTDAPTPAAAAHSRKPSDRQRVAWRGLTRPSNEPCATCQGHTVVDRGHDEENGIDLIEECSDC